jgi:hypothetical protein
MKREFLNLIRDGRKKTTIRLGSRDIGLGPLTLLSGRQKLDVQVTAAMRKTVAELTDQDAQNDGFFSLSELRNALRRFYPQMKENDLVTIVHFTTTA